MVCYSGSPELEQVFEAFADYISRRRSHELRREVPPDDWHVQTVRWMVAR
jgi:hypothetical protein